MSEIREYLDKQTDEQILSILGAVLLEDGYKRSNYTPMVENIADKFAVFGKMTENQRRAVCLHLIHHKSLWF